MKPLEFHPQSEAEFARDVDFYRERATGLASEFVTAVEEAVAFIRAHPEAGVVLTDSIRRWRVRRFPHSVVYREDPSRILVLAISHHRRRPDHWHGR